jgi:hypothetical protein
VPARRSRPLSSPATEQPDERDSRRHHND